MLVARPRAAGRRSARCSRRPRSALLTTTFTDPNERGKAFGIFGAIAGTGGAIGLLLGGVLTEYLSWRWAMYVNLAFAIPAALGARRAAADQARPRPAASIDIPGHAPATGRPVRARLRLLRAPRPTAGATADGRSPRRRRRPARRLRRARAPRRQPAAAAARACSTAPAAAPTWPSPSSAPACSRLPVPHLLPAADARLLADRDRPRVPADGRARSSTATQVATRLLRRARPAAAGHRRHGCSPRSACCYLTQLERRLELRRQRPARAARARPRHRPGHRPGDADRDRRRRPARRRRRLGDGQHHPAGRRLDRHRAAEHDLRQRGDLVRRRRPSRRQAGGPGRGPRLHHRVLVGGRDLRRSAPWSPALLLAAARRPAPRTEPALAH